MELKGQWLTAPLGQATSLTSLQLQARGQYPKLHMVPRSASPSGEHSLEWFQSRARNDRLSPDRVRPGVAAEAKAVHGFLH
jgi:hypothetical protein